LREFGGFRAGKPPDKNCLGISQPNSEETEQAEPEVSSEGNTDKAILF
jgi:hypothetical protein